MSQKSITSFFSKGAGKKEETKKQPKTTELDENPAKTKDIEDNTASSPLSKKKIGVINSDSEDESKENKKDSANGTVVQPVLDSKSLPPLRKTATNPAFKRKSSETGSEVSKRVKEEIESDDISSKENSLIKSENSKKSSPVKVSKNSKKVESDDDSPVKRKSIKKKKVVESDDESPVKSKKKKKVIESDDESPVKSKKKKKAVIDSEDENEEPSAMDISTDNTSTLKKEHLVKVSSPKAASPKKEPVESSPKKEPIESSSKKDSKESSKKSLNESSSKKSPDKESKVETPKSPEKSKPVSNFFTPKAANQKVKEESPKPNTEKETKPKAAFASFFSPKPGSAKRNEGGLDYNKKVQASSYNPVEASFWAKDEATPYLALAKTLEAIEATSGRLRTIEMLSNYLRSVMVQSPSDLLPSIYLTLNRLAPAWHGIELGIGEHILMKAIANSTGRSAAQVKTDANNLGDLGLVAEQSRGGQRTMFQPAILTVAGVFSKLQDIANLTGHSSGNKKVEKIQALLVACRGSEARYLIRSLAGKLRIGLAEQSVLQAIAQAVVQTPLGQDYPPVEHTKYKSVESDKFKEVLAKDSLKVKTAYCECPSYDILIPALLDSGVDGLAEKCKLTPGIPLKPMLAHPTKGVQEVLTRFENCSFTCEWKYDGERAQVHLHEDGKVNIYSRNQEDNTTKFPDIIGRLPKCLGKDVKSAVLDCEAVAWDREKKIIQPFQVLSTRKRKDAVEDEIKVQVCLFAFDLLYMNGETLVRKPFLERRRLLHENFSVVEGEFHYAQSVDGTTIEEIQEALEISIKDNCEGLMVKTLDVDATYEIARRSHNWLKLKKDYLDGVGDTLDLVVIGGYLGRGKRAGGYGGFLLACYDPENEEYQSICKIGTGFTDEDLAKHAEYFKDHVMEKPKTYYSHDPSLAPDHWFEPVQVWEVKCADMTISPVHKAATGIVDPAKGISLRFPRFIRIRDDKKVEDATNAEQIASMYNNQDIVKNQSKDKKKSEEDDFDF